MKSFRIPLLFLILSIVVALLTILSFYVTNYRFYPDNYTYHLLTYGALIVAVLDGAWLMWFSRHEVSRLRSLPEEHDRLQQYGRAYANQYIVAFVAICAICACIVLSYNRAIIMVLLVLVMVLVVLFPNMYKAKHDLDLSDDTMREVFGDKYIE